MSADGAVPIEINLDPEAIARQVSQAVLDSAIGENVKQAIAQALKPAYSGRSVVQAAVDSQVQEQVRVLCRKLLTEEGPIRDRVKRALDEALTPEAIAKITEKFVADLGLITAGDIGG